jgi:hypothetical protein
MAFCGQCGLLLPPNPVACPRCGSAVTASWEPVDQNANAPTTISTPDQTQHTQLPYHSKPAFSQEPNQFTGNNSQTQRDEPANNTPIPPYYAQSPFAPPDYASQAGSNVSHTQGTSFPGYTTIQGAPYPDYLPSSSPSYPPLPVPQHKTTNWTVLLFILLLLFLIAITTILLVVRPSRILQMVQGSTVASQATSAPPTSQVSTSAPPTSQVPTSAIPTPTVQAAPMPEQQAQSVINGYYTAINSQDYQTAYNLWLNYPQSYQSFANGFADTSHDDLTFGNVVQQSDGTVQTNVTIIATSTSSQQTTYQGYYLVGQQPDGTWKIISAKIHKV